MTFGLPVNNVNPIDYTGNTIPVVPCVNVPRAPTPDDKTYPLFTLWRNADENAVLPDAYGDMWYLAYFYSSNPYQAQWIKLGVAAPSGDVNLLQGDAGGPVGPDVNGAIYFQDAGTTYTTGVPLSSEMNVEVVSAANTFLLGQGPTTPSIPFGPLDDGEIPIGTTGGPPVAATITGVSGINVTNSPGSIQIGYTPPPNTSMSNLGLTLSAGTLTVTSADGTALSNSNFATLLLPKESSPGLFVEYTVTANQSFRDFSSGSSQITGNHFGVTCYTDYNEFLPFFLYAVGNAQAAVNPETQICFMISRVPHAIVSPTAGNIRALGTGGLITAGGFFALSNITVSDYADSPCVCLGSFNMTGKNTGGTTIGDWTVYPLSDFDGIGRFNDNTIYDIPPGAFSNDAGAYFQATGGDTAALFPPSSEIAFTISKDGYVNLMMKLSGIVTPGVGTNVPVMYGPYQSATQQAASDGVFLTFNSVNTFGIATITLGTASFYGDFAGTFRAVTNGDFTGVCSINGNVRYIARKT